MTVVRLWKLAELISSEVGFDFFTAYSFYACSCASGVQNINTEHLTGTANVSRTSLNSLQKVVTFRVSCVLPG